MPLGKGYTITYNGIPSTDFPAFGCEVVKRTMFGKNRDVLREVSGREGAWRFGEKKGLRSIKVEAYILADSYPIERREDLVEIGDWLNVPQGFAPLIISDEPDRYYMATLANEVDIDEWRHLGKFTLEFLADPHAYSLDPHSVDLEMESGIPELFVVEDRINAFPIVEITPVGGVLQGFTLNFNGFIMVYTAALAEDQTLTISSLSYTVTSGASTDIQLTGAFSPETIRMVDVSGEFPAILADNENQEVTLDYGVGSTATSVDMTVSWRRRFR